MNFVVPSTEGNATAGWPAHSVVAISGHVLATAPFVRALLGVDAVDRILFNAAVDPRVPFAEGVAHGLAAAEARRAGLPESPRPRGAERFLPVPRPEALNKELTSLRAVHPRLRQYGVGSQRKAIAQGCRARRRHVEDCVAAKAEGRRPPRVPRRRARHGATVTTCSFTLERPHAGPPLPKAKSRPGPNAEANRARKARRKERADTDWAQKKHDVGWTPERVTLGMMARDDRRERARARQAEAQRAYDDLRALRSHPDWQGPLRPRHRSDSPLAIVGHDALMLTVKPLPQVRIRLSRPVPEGAEVVEVHLSKASGHDERVRVVLTLRVPFVVPKFDPAAIGRAIHAAVKHLASDAPALAFVEAARKAGIPCVGEDSNISAPSATSDGRRTPPLKRDRVDVKVLKALDRRASHKRAEWLKRQPAPPPRPEDFVGPVRPARPPRYVPSNRARKLDKLRRGFHRHWADAARTRACRDARLLVERMVLVATDPKRMVRPLLAKGGPADRRAKREALGLEPTAPLPDTSATAIMRPSAKRTMRGNLHRTRIGFRVDRVGRLCGAAGAIHATPGHEHTSQDCPGCPARRRKGLGERTHRCPDCGTEMDRDVAAATVNVGNALRQFRDTPDPGGSIAAAEDARLEALAKAEKTRERRRKGGKARRKDSAGVPVAVIEGVCALGAGKPPRGTSGEDVSGSKPRQVQTESLPGMSPASSSRLWPRPSDGHMTPDPTIARGRPAAPRSLTTGPAAIVLGRARVHPGRPNG